MYVLTIALSLLSIFAQFRCIARLNRSKTEVLADDEDALEALLHKHLRMFLRQATSPVQLLLRLYAHEPGAIGEMDAIYEDSPGEFEFYMPQVRVRIWPA